MSNGGAQLSVLSKSSFSYVVNVTSGIGVSALVPITITLLPVARPPVVSNQVLSTPDNIAPSTSLSPALTASQPLGLSFTFALVDATGTWGVVPATGVVYLMPGKSLSFSTVPSYTCTIVVTASNSLTAQAFLTINLTPTNRPPTFCCGGFWDLTVDEGTAAGTILNGGAALSASDPNAGDVLLYTITGTSISQAAGLVSLDVIAGRLGLAAVLPGGTGVLLYNRSWSWPPASRYSFNVSVSVSDSSWVPALSANGTARITITRIAPRLATTTFSFPNNITAGAAIANLSAVMWSPYGGATFSMAVNDVAVPSSAQQAFNVTSAGILVAVAPLAPFNFNVKTSFTVSVLLTDVQGTTATVPLALTLQHSNRAPTWGSLPTFYTAAATNTTSIGSPLSVYVSDLDLGIVAESLTFSLLATGNTGGTFGVDPASGRLFIAALGSPAFNFPNSFNLTACVRDAGIDGPSSSSCTFVSVVLTQNQDPPILPALNLTVLEGSPPGTLVAQINATNINPGARISYALSPGAALLNLPFPFAISTVNATPFNYGLLTTTAASPIRYSPYAGTGNFRTYPVFVTATDTRLGFPLTTTVATTISVIWVVDG